LFARRAWKKSPEVVFHAAHLHREIGLGATQFLPMILGSKPVSELSIQPIKPCLR